MTQTFEILNFGHCDLFAICYLKFDVGELWCREIILIHKLNRTDNDNKNLS